MTLRRSLVSYALAVAMGITLVFAGHGAALAGDSDESSRQPDLKSWSNKIPTPNRFVVLADFNHQAVLDRETGLVWEVSPSATHMSLHDALTACANRNTGDRMGWRLPSFSELASLVDQSQTQPSLPKGHPFTSLDLEGNYWSATSDSQFSSLQWVVSFVNGLVFSANKGNVFPAWCVRGPMNADAY